MLFEIRESKSNRHVDFIKANSEAEAKNVFYENFDTNYVLVKCDVKNKTENNAKIF